MDNAQMFAVIIAFFIPPVLALVQQPTWPDWLRSALMFVVAVAVGTGTLYFAGTLAFDTGLATNILLVLVTAIGVYHGFYKPTGIAPAIEHATSGTLPTTGSVVKVAIDDTPIATVPITPPATPPSDPPPAS